MTTLDHVNAALEACANAQVAASQDALDRAHLEAEITGLTLKLVDRDAVIVQQSAEIDRLRALLDDPPPQRTMLVGASVQRRVLPDGDAETWSEARERFEASIGKRLQIVRRYISGRPPANPVTHPALADVLDGRYEALAISFVDGTTDEIVTFLRGLPATGTTCYVAIRHEPDKQLRMAPATFRGKCNALLEAVDEVGRDDVVPMFVLMSWLERDGEPETSSQLYMPITNVDRWVMGLDPYLGKPENTYASQVGQTVALWRELGGQRIAITEWGVKTTGQTAVDQITRFINDAEADGCEFACYFDSGEGDNAGAGWYLDLRGAEAVAAFGGLL